MQNFPAVDMFFVKEREVDKKKEVFGIQVTIAKQHQIEKTAYEELYKRFGLDPEADAITIYIISSSENAESSANGLMSYFYKKGIKPLPKLCFAAVRLPTDFK